MKVPEHQSVAAAFVVDLELDDRRGLFTFIHRNVGAPAAHDIYQVQANLLAKIFRHLCKMALDPCLHAEIFV